jgi:hypothetical protein
MLPAAVLAIGVPDVPVVIVPVTFPIMLPVIEPMKPFRDVTGPVKVVDAMIIFLFAQVAY